VVRSSAASDVYKRQCLECGSRAHYVAKCKSFVDEKCNTLFRIETVERVRTDWYLVLGFTSLALYAVNSYMRL
jgi:hypothetical protein